MKIVQNLNFICLEDSQSWNFSGDESLKGILKNGDDLENDLVCNVPDHQDLVSLVLVLNCL